MASEEKLLKAGLEVFSRYGFDGATTKLISTTAGLNETLITRYFGGKEGLLLAIVEGFADRIRDTGLPYPEQPGFAQELEAYLEFRIKLFFEYQPFFRIILSRGVLDKAFARKIQNHCPVDQSPLFLARLRRLQDAGHIQKNVDIDEINCIVNSHLIGIISCLPFSDKQTAAEYSTRLRAFAKLLSSGLKR